MQKAKVGNPHVEQRASHQEAEKVNEMGTASAQCVVQSMVDLTKTQVPPPKLALSGPGTVLPVRRAAKTKSANSRFFFFRARRFCFFRNKMLRICGVY